MSTMTEDRDEGLADAPPPRDADLVTMPHCTRCNLPYVPTKSTSALRLTYCSFLCELGDLGFSMTGLEQMVRKQKPVVEAVAD
ncbi:MAG: hypothetical protein ABI782_02155 [Anaerolineaceae bacterium]